MISRTWHGVVPIEYKDEFHEYEIETGLKEMNADEACLGVYLKIVDQDSYSHFFLCSIWTDMEAVKRFAGDTTDIAGAYPSGEEYKLISDPISILQEVAENENPFE